jgi:GNAT superfamily N-acetyltransferase
MEGNNFERMIQLAGEVFNAHNDPEQLDVDEQVIEHLKLLHPSTISEYADEKGPAVWILLIPTTRELMNQFLEHTISEQKLLDLTPMKGVYTCIYLCSAMTLPEYRGKGIAKRLTLEAITTIRKTHPIETLFVWPFSETGAQLSALLAKETGLKLMTRK